MSSGDLEPVYDAQLEIFAEMTLESARRLFAIRSFICPFYWVDGLGSSCIEQLAMETTTQPDIAQEDHHDGHDDHGHDNQHFLTKYVFSSDHKVIGIQYGVTSLVLLVGFR